MLLHSGFYFTARGQAERDDAIAGAVILGDITLRKERRGINELYEEVVLGSNEDLTSLTETQRRNTEAILSRVTQKKALVRRSGGGDELATQGGV